MLHTSTYWYGLGLSTYFFCLFLYRLQVFIILKGYRDRDTSGWYMLTLVEYEMLVPDSIARLPDRPADLLASDSGTGSRIEANHTKALPVAG